MHNANIGDRIAHPRTTPTRIGSSKSWSFNADQGTAEEAGLSAFAPQ